MELIRGKLYRLLIPRTISPGTLIPKGSIIVFLHHKPVLLNGKTKADSVQCLWGDKLVSFISYRELPSVMEKIEKEPEET